MLDDHITDPLIDDVINNVAREMTSAPPDPMLARRVAVRLAAGHDERRGRAWWWVAAPMATACVLVVAVFVVREGSVRLKPDATTDATKTSAAPPYVGRGFQPRLGDPERVALRTERDAPPPDEPPPNSLPPIAIERLDVDLLMQVEPISIAAIAFGRIEISEMP